MKRRARSMHAACYWVRRAEYPAIFMHQDWTKSHHFPPPPAQTRLLLVWTAGSTGGPTTETSTSQSGVLTS